MRPLRILAISHSSAGAERAATLLPTGARILAPTPGRDPGRAAVRAVLAGDADLLYLVDTGRTTALAAAAAHAGRVPFILDSGDLAYELARSTGSHGTAGEQVIRLAEQLCVRTARHVVVRGREHRRYIGHDRVTVVPDVAPPGVGPVDGSRLRTRLALDDAFVAGLVGSLVRAPRLGVSYGWDIIEAVALAHPSVHALIVGDGTGAVALQRRARELGIHERCRFVGRVPSREVAAYLAVMDVGISTQSNDRVGSVRTTGKLPLYLACALPVLATDVGEAHHLLGPLGWTLPYNGTVDRAHPARLAAALESWRTDASGAAGRCALALQLSQTAFSAAEMQRRIRSVMCAAAG